MSKGSVRRPAVKPGSYERNYVFIDWGETRTRPAGWKGDESALQTRRRESVCEEEGEVATPEETPERTES